MAEQSGYYTLGSTSPFVGKSLEQINQAGAQNQPGFQGIGFNPADFAKYLNISSSAPLTAGQQLSYSGGASPGDTTMLGKIFTPETQAQVGQANALADNQFIQQQNQPAISALQQSVPIEQKMYQDIINQITQGVGAQYAQRGLSNTSPQMGQDIATASLPAANQQSNSLQNIFNQIGQLQSGNPLAALQTGVGQEQFGAQNQIAQQQLALQQAIAPFQQALAQAQASQAKYLPIPYFGAINTLTGNPITATSSQISQTGSDGKQYTWTGSGWVLAG